LQYYSCWSIDILPYLEQDNLFKTYNNKIPNQDPANQAFCKTPLAVYNCPSDPRPSGQMTVAPETLAPNAGRPTNPPRLYATSSYKAMTGLGRTSNTNTFGGFWDEVQSALAGNPQGAGVFHGDGLSGLSPEKMVTITDGTSNTIMVGERHT